jgi:hypothetical protein
MDNDSYEHILFVFYVLYCSLIFQSSTNYGQRFYSVAITALIALTIHDPQSDAAKSSMELLGNCSYTAIFYHMTQRFPDNFWIKTAFVVLFLQTHIFNYFSILLLTGETNDAFVSLNYVLYIFHVVFALDALRRRFIAL